MKPPLLESKAVRRYINFPSSRFEEITGNVDELNLETKRINVSHASTPNTKTQNAIRHSARERGHQDPGGHKFRAATSNVLKYFQESRNPPSTQELEAVTRFINIVTSVCEREAEKETKRKKASSEQSIKLEETLTEVESDSGSASRFTKHLQDGTIPKLEDVINFLIPSSKGAVDEGKETMSKTSSFNQPNKHLEETFGNKSNVASSSRGCPGTERVWD